MNLIKRFSKMKVTDWLRVGYRATIDVERKNGAVATVTAAALAGLAPTSRIVTTTSTALTLTEQDHAERMVLVNSNSTVANTFTLPPATGSGLKYTLVNNILQTQGTVVFAANGTDVLAGICTAINSTAGNCDSFLTTATSDKMSLNLTTTGGLGGDILEAWDRTSGEWYVRATIYGSGTLATPFSAT